MFDNVVIKMGCRGANEYGVKAPKRKMDRRTGALTIIESVLGDTEKCRPAITGCDDKLEEALAHIRVPVREVPWGKRKDRGKVLYGTRTSMLMHYIPEVKGVVAVEQGEEGEEVFPDHDYKDVKVEKEGGKPKQSYEEKLKQAGIPFSE